VKEKHMKKKKMHYCGRIEHRRGICLFGWPVCCSGDKAETIRKQRNQTTNIFDVNCAKCLELYANRTNR
jgi:hypothetical protein